MEIILKFADSISEAYRKKLETFLDNILAQGLTENQPPSIYFFGMNLETSIGIRKLQLAYFNHYIKFSSQLL